jgi:hypothetical protein
MVDWQVTATTIYCDAVDDEITIIVYQDGTVKCTGRQKYTQPGKETAKEMKRKSKQVGKQLGCKEDECSAIIQYRDKLLSQK